MHWVSPVQWYDIAIRLLVATIIGCIIGVERERKNRPAGMRTHVLVCVGAAMVATLECLLTDSALSLNASHAAGGVSMTMGRMSAQVISGIGFLGAGTIFISSKKIAGLTTAASLWNAACLGLVSGMGYYVLAGTGALVVLVTLSLLNRVVKVNTLKCVEVKYIHRVETQTFINEYFEKSGIQVLDIDFHVENKGKVNTYTNIFTLTLPNKMSYKDIVSYLSEHQNVLMVRTRNT